MHSDKRDLRRELYSVSRRLLSKAALSAVIIPLVVFALFSLTIFRFSSSQFLIFLIALTAVVAPFVIILSAIFAYRQRRLLRGLEGWYGEKRDASSQADSDLAVRLQREVDRSSSEHAVLVGVGSFLAIALSVLFFGGYAGFTVYTSLAYISLGALLALTDFFITYFISHREMRPVLRTFLSDCEGYGFHTAPGIGRLFFAFSAVILLLTLGITWIASSYISSDMLRSEIAERGKDNVRLLALELDSLIEGRASHRELEEVSAGLALSGDVRLAVFDQRGREAFTFSTGAVGESAWQELSAAAAGGQEEVVSRFEQVGSRDYLLTAAPLSLNEGWTLLRVELPETSFYALWRLSPTMLLLLLIGAGVALYLTALMRNNIADPIKRLVETCRVVTAGDLSADVPVDSLDDFGKLSSSYGEMLRSLRHISSELRRTSGEVNEGAVSIVAVSEQTMGATEELNALVQDLSGQVEHEVEQIRKVEEIMGSVSETISMSHAESSRSLEISRDAERLVVEGREHASDAVEKIADFKEVLDESMSAILSLGDSSQEIGTIVDIITRIADQTNLLALNAAIEAARVPEFGKGFAVVAGEVKKLAQEAAGSAQRIHDLVQAIREDVETAKSLVEKGIMSMYTGMETVERTDRSLLSISDVVDQMARMAGSIAEASSRELDESEMLADSLNAVKESVMATTEAYEKIGASSEEQTAVTLELTGTAERLSEIASRLQEMVAHFKIS